MQFQRLPYSEMIKIYFAAGTGSVVAGTGSVAAGTGSVVL